MSKCPYRKFVIICTARTGSTMLWSYLNSHPDILCLSSVYDRNDRINFGKFYGYLPDVCWDRQLVEERDKKPVDFLENYIFKIFSRSYKAVGFKYFYYNDRFFQNKNALVDYFILNKDIVFLHIKRKNILASLFSFKRALNQDQWITADVEFETEICITECERYFKNTTEQQNRFDSLFGDRIFHVIYEDFELYSQEILINIQKFIEVSPFKLETEMIQNKNKKLSETITNFAELKSHFDKSVYSDFFNEYGGDR